MRHNFFEEAKNTLGISGNLSEMAREISKMVTRKARELASKYIDDTVFFKDAEHMDPYREVHYKISWGSENNDSVSEVWADGVFTYSEWSGLYCKRPGIEEACNQFEYIREIERIKKEQ